MSKLVPCQTCKVMQERECIFQPSCTKVQAWNKWLANESVTNYIIKSAIRKRKAATGR